MAGVERGRGSDREKGKKGGDWGEKVRDALPSLFPAFAFFTLPTSLPFLPLPRRLKNETKNGKRYSVMKFSTTEFCFSFDPNREATGLPM